MLAAKFGYISHYYDELSMKQTHRYRGRAITRLGLNSASGVVAFLTSNRNRFEILPDRVAEKIEFGEEAGSELCVFIECPFDSAADMIDIRRGFMTCVPEAYREEVEFLMGLLKRNGLLASETDVIQAGAECIQEIKRKDNHHAVSEVYLDKLEERLPTNIRKRKEEQLVAAVKALTSMDVLVLSSFAKAIQVSDCDLELLLLNPVISTIDFNTAAITGDDLATEFSGCPWARTPPFDDERVRAIREMATTIKNAGFESVLLRKRYFDITCKVNPHYICFCGPKTELTCQVTLYNPFDIHTHELLQTYATIDSRVEPFDFAVQKTLYNHSRSREASSNYTTAVIAIHFLQHKLIFPKLLHHQGKRVDFGFHTGKAVNVLLRTPETSMPTRDIVAIVPLQSATQANNTNRRGRNGSQCRGGSDRDTGYGREVSSVGALINPATAPQPTITSASEASYATEIKSKTTLHPNHLAISFRYDKNLARKRPYDESRSKQSVINLLVDVFEYTVSKFKSWERYLPSEEDLPEDTFSIVGLIDHRGKKCSMFMPGTAQTFTSKSFCGLVVQDPFVMDRNITWLCTGWCFMSTSKVFQRARDSTCCHHKGKSHQELMLEDLSEMEEVVNLRLFDVWDSFGEAVVGQSLKNVAELLIAINFAVEEINENGTPF
ncbi:hypothetical protein BG015_004724 [Linnemannia schmuckeri]|uniref:Uncharacterized protein n=1 Tax=Linnemannia schmuckeri TaxID=64567 RepID=A0A9P5S6R6_9FUNG|nr:hypothetical protein BG015_004724 [Linnemannia schmuckeri]